MLLNLAYQGVLSIFSIKGADLAYQGVLSIRIFYQGCTHYIHPIYTVSEILLKPCIPRYIALHSDRDFMMRCCSMCSVNPPLRGTNEEDTLGLLFNLLCGVHVCGFLCSLWLILRTVPPSPVRHVGSCVWLYLVSSWLTIEFIIMWACQGSR